MGEIIDAFYGKFRVKTVDGKTEITGYDDSKNSVRLVYQDDKRTYLLYINKQYVGEYKKDDAVKKIFGG